jgi:hypothetical protein
MPTANYFGPTVNGLTSDGLNTATIRWTRRRSGSDVDVNGISQTTTGLGDDWARKQINIKIDHNFTNSHKLSGSYTTETNYAELNQPGWPNGYSGEVNRKPHVVTLNFTSTLSATLVNEGRFGMRFNKTASLGAFENKNSENLKEPLEYFTGGPDPGFTRAAGQTYSVLVGGVGNGISSYNFFSGSGGLFNLGASHNGNRSILFTYGDTLSWTKGKHAFKFGGEYRPSTSRGYSNLPNLPHLVSTQGPAPSPPRLSAVVRRRFLPERSPPCVGTWRRSPICCRDQLIQWINFTGSTPIRTCRTESGRAFSPAGTFPNGCHS